MHKIQKKSNFIILLPVYNDWYNLNILLKKIKKIHSSRTKIKILIVNDCSTINNYKLKFKKLFKIEVLNLSKNVGSQRAIAIGLNYIHKKYLQGYKFTIIMDSDGQDNPKILPKMINYFDQNKDEVLVVQRINRKENRPFKILYGIYKLTFTIFTWKIIKFGNFSLINNKFLFKIVNTKDLWAAYPSTIIQKFSKIKKINLDRDKRYKGNTKMNILKLLDHSLRVFLVFKKKIFFVSIIYCLLLSSLIPNQIINFFLFFLIINTTIILRWLINFQNFKKAKTGIKFNLI